MSVPEVYFLDMSSCQDHHAKINDYFFCRRSYYTRIIIAPATRQQRTLGFLEAANKELSFRFPLPKIIYVFYAYFVTSLEQPMSIKIKIVTIENYLRHVGNTEADRFFSKMIKARFEGYRHDYAENMMPFDDVDFVATHHLFCLQENEDFTPIAAARHITLRLADWYHLELPIVKLVKDSGSVPHNRLVENLLKEHRDSNKELLYSSRFTICKNYRSNRELSRQIIDMFCALKYHDFTQQHVHTVFAGSALRFKTHIFLKQWGYEELRMGQESFGVVSKVSANNEPVLLMSLTQMSAHSKICYEKHSEDIQQRIAFNSSLETINKAA
jgi:hypothetical protein